MRLIPKTHKNLGWPDDHTNIEKIILMKLGYCYRTIVVANLNLWHAGAKNLNGKSSEL